MTKEQLESIRAREKAATGMDGVGISWLHYFGEEEAAKSIPLLLAEIDRLSGIESAACGLIQAIARGDGSDQTKTTQLVLIRTAATVFMDKYGAKELPIKAGS